MYVPTEGCIVPAIHRSRLFGPLLAYEGRLGEKVRALGGHLQPRGASHPCCDSVFEATVAVIVLLALISLNPSCGSIN